MARTVGRPVRALAVGAGRGEGNRKLKYAFSGVRADTCRSDCHSICCHALSLPLALQIRYCFPVRPPASHVHSHVAESVDLNATAQVSAPMDAHIHGTAEPSGLPSTHRPGACSTG
ncbi:hypothetical protein DAEQUDRAFT_347373 [Daedalea quercina L-15889]|uniref:Uncharacterized protein n=1 Tax=Daedalea quercina L-15889 TaxID=1314783 RepID=A0A165PCU8_9APHY|nr:hypothetical protein DAEQUDRAFT_347373 [Daedalea quercina L-15889]